MRQMVVFLLMWSLLCTTLYAQQPSYNFRKLGLPEGLHDVTTRCIGQDRMGYIWVGTVGALNRFDGKNVAHFTYVVHDTTSCYNSQPRTIHSDAHGRFWIGYETGLVEFDFDKANFKRIKALEGMYINAIASTTEGILFLATRQGLIKYDSKTNTILPLEKRSKTGSSILNHGMFDLVLRNQKLFIAGSRGVVVYHLKADTAHAVNVSPLNNQAVYSLALDNQDNIWAGSVDRIKLARLNNDLKQWTVYDHLLASQITGQPPVVADILIDRSNKVWIATGTDGLMEFHPDVLTIKQFIHHPDIPSSPSGNDYRCLFQDKDHNIWLGCDFWGVNFFDPGKSLFETITPHPDKLHQRQRGVGRGAAQDKNGLLWMGNHDGVSCYNPATRTYREWTNKEDGKRIIYDNQVRTLLCDRENNIWIGTGSGVNRYNAETGEMEFISPEHLPNSFYNSINMDREGKIWFCTNDSATLYWYDPLTKTYDNICHHPQLKVFCNLTPTSYVLEDSKGRVWISLSRHGIGMWNKRTGEIRQYKIPMDGKPGIPGNQIVDIKEDHNGIIWTSSFNGVCGLDSEKDSFIVFDVNNGLPGNRCSPLAIDGQNRVWVGVNGGLVMIDADRKQLTKFTDADGLPFVGFPEHGGIVLNNGDFLFPTYRGYLKFNPMAYKGLEKNIPFYLSGYAVFEKKYLPPVADLNHTPQIDLSPSENSITFNLVALNYNNPNQTWYAYKLDGFEKEWHYTQDPKAVYTNVPGGKYTFLYKAGIGQNSWDAIAPKSLIMNIDIAFYRAFWFWLLISILLATGLYLFYRYRLQQHRQILSLETKAEALEKEKTMIQYESLKQHLNPHFLFNSLTSLRSLIKTDSKTAAWFLDGLSKVYRYVLKSAEQELVALKDEASFVQTFGDMQKVRFGEGFDLRIHIDDEAGQKLIAPVILQNLVENAIKHNTTSIDEPLVVEIFNEEDALVVRNNLQRYRIVETSNKQGLESLRKLYSFFSDRPIIIDEDEKHFTVRIPLL